jgi:hypothetical protein
MIWTIILSIITTLAIIAISIYLGVLYIFNEIVKRL